MNDDLTLTLSPSQAAASGSANIQPDPVITTDEVAARMTQYDALETIGSGGVGSVFKARQRSLDRRVALKILRSEWAEDETFIERFRREARTLANLTHPRIVAVYDSGESGGFFFIAMEYVGGGSLKELMARGRLPPARVLEIADELCDALTAAHAAHVTHRDIKPSNVLLDDTGHVKLCDFGLSKSRRTDTAELTLTSPSLRMGTPNYVAPEQWEDTATADHRADIYSLGVVLYEMLTGQKPIGAYPSAAEKAGLSRRVDTVLARALQPDPTERFQTIAELRTELHRAWKPRLTPKRIAKLSALALALATAALGIIPLRNHLTARNNPPPAPQKALYFEPHAPAAPPPPVDEDTFQDCEY